MARLPRIVIPDQALHIVQRGNNRQPVFFADEDYRHYLQCLMEAAEKYDCAIHAYVLMTNHVHLLLTPDTDTGPSSCLQSVGRKYVRYINGVYRRSGTLWEGRFKSALIDSDRYVLSCYRYIELNPVRANMVTGPGQYPWSSYNANALGKENKLITPHSQYLRLGTSGVSHIQAYRALFQHHVDAETLKTIRTGTEQGTVVGGERFQVEIAIMLKRRVTKHDHGGDRKSEDFQKEKSSTLTP